MEITVVGQSMRKVEPELGVLKVRVAFESAERDEAVRRAREGAAAVVDFTAEETGGEKADGQNRVVVEALRTHSWTPTSVTGEVMPERWNASIGVQVRARGVEALQRCVDHLGGVDGSNIEGIEWRLSEESRRVARAEVLAEAVQDAMTRAQAMADAAGAGAVELTEIADPGLLSGPQGPGAPRPAQPFMRTAAAGGAFNSESVIALQPDALELSETVHARFRA
ncbi:MAG TPA: SIMPL domain-containing protein [Actinomycetaceae bacterium]|nr:SIMPL domain-containing protein [Actinomycetaceae bacterium]